MRDLQNIYVLFGWYCQKDDTRLYVVHYLCYITVERYDRVSCWWLFQGFGSKYRFLRLVGDRFLQLVGDV